MRVIAGRLGGRRFAAPSGRDTRPTADRVREALFSALAARIPGAIVLDLYAGSGALAIEALSRGAEHAVLVESDRRAAAVLERNIADLGLTDDVELLQTTAERFAADPFEGPFDVVFCDPPYATPLPRVLDRITDLHAAGALAEGAVVVVERDRRDPDLDAAPPRFLVPGRRRSYGDTLLLSYDVLSEEPPS